MKAREECWGLKVSVGMRAGEGRRGYVEAGLSKSKLYENAWWETRYLNGSTLPLVDNALPKDTDS